MSELKLSADLTLSNLIVEKLKKIRLLLLDVDGVLTDGSITWIAGQGFTRTYHAHDGYGIRLIQKLGLPVGVISGGQSQDLKERLQFLGIQHFVLGSEDKFASLTKMSEETKIPLEQICFIGDDLFDIPALEKVGLAVTVPNAVPEVKEVVHFITTIPGGKGAVRQVIDALRKVQNLK
jgi:3-deoxy-D-manno-octulosonate 8-phosphate phosphatase (KDO 8-P phosphatase)